MGLVYGHGYLFKSFLHKVCKQNMLCNVEVGTVSVFYKSEARPAEPISKSSPIPSYSIFNNHKG
jgi:hypothetical protein